MISNRVLESAAILDTALLSASSVVNRRAAGCKLAEDFIGFFGHHVFDHFDIAGFEFLFPLWVNRTFVEAGNLFDFFSGGSERQLPNA